MILRQCLWAGTVGVLCFGGTAAADDSAVRQSDQFVALVKEGRFGEGAAAFHYPPTYTPAELATDKAAIVHFLEHLIQEIGRVVDARRIDRPPGRFLDLAIGGGDIPYWSSHPELNRVELVTYEVQTKKEGKVYFAISLIQPTGRWELRNFTFELPESRPGAAERILELGQKVFPPNSKGPT